MFLCAATLIILLIRRHWKPAKFHAAFRPTPVDSNNRRHHYHIAGAGTFFCRDEVARRRRLAQNQIICAPRRLLAGRGTHPALFGDLTGRPQPVWSHPASSPRAIHRD